MEDYKKIAQWLEEEVIEEDYIIDSGSDAPTEDEGHNTDSEQSGDEFVLCRKNLSCTPLMYQGKNGCK